MEQCPLRWNCDIEDLAAPLEGPDLPDDTYNVVIIGAGCVGASVARELSRYQLKVLVLEKSDDVTQGATKGNSGIVHAGFDDKPGSVRAKYCPKGNRMFPDLDRDLKFGFQKNGSLVVARGKEEEAILTELLDRGKKNDVRGLKILGQAELRRVEPNIAPEATAALFAPDAGIVIPFEFTIALAENAAMNGVEFRCNREVASIDSADSGYCVSVLRHERARSANTRLLATLAAVGTACAASIAQFDGFVAAAVLAVLVVALIALSFRSTTPPQQREVVKTSYIVNCAGLYADHVAAMIGDRSFTITPRLGEYILLKRPAITAKEEAPACRHTVFPCPGKMGKGILVQPTLWGNLCLGPTAFDTTQRTADYNPASRQMSKREIMDHILEKCRELIPSFDATEAIHSFAGVRAKSSRGDWIIEPAPQHPRFIHAAGIDSPGLAGSPAIALEVVRLLGAAGCELAKKSRFQPKRKPYVIPKDNYKMMKGDKKVAIKLNHEDPELNVVCRCELVTEGEIVDAIRRGMESSIKAETTQAIRKRTRAGMGWCQGQYCEPRVKALIAKETGVALNQVPGRSWPESSLLDRRHQFAESKGKTS
jgi:glycerol-3-phosphate dehydrogenase